VTIKQHYQTQITERGFFADREQTEAVEQFQRLYNELFTPQSAPGLLSRLLKQTPAAPQGLYLWGGPGRGKTCLMDLFYHHLPTQQKQRLHFHHFMQNIHAELATIKNRGEPLKLIAARVAEKTRVLCLDEFYVADIGDAMLLAGLLDALFTHGVVLVTTSNTTPDNLYRNGLQRERFLPAINLIQQHTQLVEMHQGNDYRLDTVSDDAFNHYQLSSVDEAETIMVRQFHHLCGKEQTPINSTLQLLGRDIALRAEAANLVWFDFATLCETPRSTGDYLELARRYRRVMITHIPLMNEALDNAAIRFIHLIDALYDRRVELIATAAASPEKLYCGIHHTRSFRRAASRLSEMASPAYIIASRNGPPTTG